MEVTTELVDKVANLAKLAFNSEQKEAIKNDLKRMIAFVDQLEEVDTTGVEPLIFISKELNVSRKDIAIQEISQQEALKNAPKKDSDYFKVPKVIDKE